MKKELDRISGSGMTLKRKSVKLQVVKLSL